MRLSRAEQAELNSDAIAAHPADDARQLYRLECARWRHMNRYMFPEPNCHALDEDSADGDVSCLAYETFVVALNGDDDLLPKRDALELPLFASLRCHDYPLRMTRLRPERLAS